MSGGMVHDEQGAGESDNGHGESGSHAELAELLGLAGISSQPLSPIPNDVLPEIREFAQTLRVLFGALGMSLNRVAALLHSDPGTVSRYLSGKRVPPPEFIDSLCKAVYDAKGSLVTSQVQELVHEQFLIVLQVHNPTRYKVQRLTDLLQDAAQDKQHHELTVAALEEAIKSRNDKIYKLELEGRQLQSARARAEGLIEEERKHRKRLQETIDSLYAEVSYLKEQLISAQQRATEAEQRCRVLEAQLDSAGSALLADEPVDDGRRRDRPSPAQLPPEPAGFVGRAAELEWLHALLPRPSSGPGGAPQTSLVALITGTAGVGKTTLAIRFARQVLPLFPDGQLYVNLRGFGIKSGAIDPSAALQGFFDALAVPAMNVPATLEAQSALLRTLLDGKRMLLLLDNAHDADQVRALLPGRPGCLALVTSRSQLTGLVVEGARPISLDVLNPREATELVAVRLGAERAAGESAAVAAIVEHSAGLPLALGVACARAVARPGLRLADLAAELADARGRLDALRTGEDTTDLRAVLSSSADKLSEPAARMFRLLGLHHGPDISVAAAASLAGATTAKARAALAELARASLLTQDTGDRFSCHDLLRAYAAELAWATLSAEERALAERRTLDHYVRSAHAAAARLYPARGQVPLPPEAKGVTAEEFAGPDAYDSALSWFAVEHRVLRNTVEQAAAQRQDEHCWKLAWDWAPFLKRRGMLHEVLAVQRTAVLAAGRLGDRDALAHVHYELGHVSGRLRDYAAADEHLRQALDLFTELGDQASIGRVRHGFAQLLTVQGRYDEALDHAVTALQQRRSSEGSAEIAYSENAVGWILAHLGQPDAALWYCRRALEMHTESGSRTGVADTLDSIAYAYGRLADFEQSIQHYQRSIEMYRLLGDLEGVANSRLHFGDVQHASGQPDAARRSWQQALALLSQIPGADTAEVSGRLRAGSPPADGTSPADSGALK